jgi:DNA end-binding protein Ku
MLVDPIFFESSYYVAAEDKTAKPYVHFLAALTETKQDAIAKIAMHNREHVVLIRPSNAGLVLHTLYYLDELHKANRSETPKAKYTAKELEPAKSLVDQLTAPFKPREFQDTYQPAKLPVGDLMEALKRSLKSAPKKTARRNNKAA